MGRLVLVQNLSVGTLTDWRDTLGDRLLGLLSGLLTPGVCWLATRLEFTERRHRLLRGREAPGAGTWRRVWQ